MSLHELAKRGTALQIRAAIGSDSRETLSVLETRDVLGETALVGAVLFRNMFFDQNMYR